MDTSGTENKAYAASRIPPDNSGFTLVELMVVVAIIGVLASVAIPNYIQYAEKARQAEAKIELAALYTSLESFAAENGSFTTCLEQAGFEPTANTIRYYNVGFTGAANTSTCGPNGAASCLTYNFVSGSTCSTAVVSWGGSSRTDIVFFSQVTYNSGSPSRFAPGYPWPSYTATQNTFLVESVGYINSSPTAYLDLWTIDEDKTLTWLESGL